MTDQALIILAVAMAAFTYGLMTGLRLARVPPRDRDPDWRRSFNHENTNRSAVPPPLLYQPRSQGGTPNPPPRNHHD